MVLTLYCNFKVFDFWFQCILLIAFEKCQNKGKILILIINCFRDSVKILENINMEIKIDGLFCQCQFSRMYMLDTWSSKTDNYHSKEKKNKYFKLLRKN